MTAIETLADIGFDGYITPWYNAARMDVTAGKPRVLLADDHLILLDGLRRLLEMDYEIVGTATSGPEMIAAERQLRPDVIIFDISMPGLNGIDAARQVRRVNAGVKLVALTMHSDAGFLNEALDAGADAYLVKQSAGVELKAALRTALEGRTYIGVSLRSAFAQTGRMTTRGGGHPWLELTPRQREVLQLVAEGRTMKQVAWRLGLSIKTAEYHKYALMRKLRVRSVAELTLCAARRGMVGPGQD